MPKLYVIEGGVTLPAFPVHDRPVVALKLVVAVQPSIYVMVVPELFELLDEVDEDEPFVPLLVDDEISGAGVIMATVATGIVIAFESRVTAVWANALPLSVAPVFNTMAV